MFKKINKDIFVDWNDTQLKKLFNQQRETEIFECPDCLNYMINCLMNDNGLYSFNDIFYCSNCDSFYTSQSYVVKTMIKVDSQFFN